MEQAILSVVVPVYNAAQTLERCLKSIEYQTFKEYELLLIDDGSIDNSGKLCDAYAQSHDNVQVIHQENKGASEARNRGIELAKGQYLIFIDCDDEVECDEFAVYMDAAINSQADVIVGGLTLIETVDNSQRVVLPPEQGTFGSEVWNQICRNSEPFGYMVSKMFKLSLIREHAVRFNPVMRSQEDLDFCLSYYRHCKQFSLIDYAGYKYYHFPAKRKLPPSDYVSNQLKILDAANKNRCNSKSLKAVEDRIQSFIWTLFYNAKDTKELKYLAEALDVTGVKQIIQPERGISEKKIIYRYYWNGQLQKASGYFKIRKMLKRLKR